MSDALTADVMGNGKGSPPVAPTESGLVSEPELEESLASPPGIVSPPVSAAPQPAPPSVLAVGLHVAPPTQSASPCVLPAAGAPAEAPTPAKAVAVGMAVAPSPQFASPCVLPAAGAPAGALTPATAVAVGISVGSSVAPPLNSWSPVSPQSTGGLVGQAENVADRARMASEKLARDAARARHDSREGIGWYNVFLQCENDRNAARNWAERRSRLNLPPAPAPTDAELEAHRATTIPEDIDSPEKIREDRITWFLIDADLGSLEEARIK